MTKAFESYHPLVNFIYFTVVLGFSMFVMQPVFLGLSILGALSFQVVLRGWRRTGRQLLWIFPVFAISACVNPLFSHQGVTILGYFRDGNPLTLESICYGLAAAFMLVSMLLWFGCVHEVMTQERIVCLFGKILPAFSLLLSMVLRFVPRFRAQTSHTLDAQKGAGSWREEKSSWRRARLGLHLLSIMTTWALENSVDTADSMKARGYGLKRRTNYSIYTLQRRDLLCLGVILLIAGELFLAMATGRIGVQFYPYLQMNAGGVYANIAYGSYFILVFLPVMLEGREVALWRTLNCKR